MEEKFNFIEGGVELIAKIEPLWEALNNYHQNKAIYFSNKFKENTFERRHKKFFNEGLTVRIEIIKTHDDEQVIGYILSSIDEEGNGEIESLYIEEEYREHKLGYILMTNAIKWLESNKSSVIRTKVADGNESVMKFYRKFGFETRSYTLEKMV